jgi:uncharacterized protein (DUF305 family)
MKNMSHQHPYRRLFLMSLLAFAVMYVLMYAMVDRLANVYTSLNQVYMALLMTGAMVLVELALMTSMYPDRRSNLIATAASLAFLLVAWFGIRKQTAIGDRQFLRSMIPHHGGAILMCQQAALTDPELIALCQRIVQGQQGEIEQMKAALEHRGT